MNVVIYGASGMLGSGVLLECLDDPSVESVLLVLRRALGISNPKVREIVLPDFLDYSRSGDTLGGLDACFYCLGVTSVGANEADYRRVTHDYTIAAAKALLAQSPGLTMCFISGANTDSAGRAMWARVKGATEDDLRALPFKACYLFRPGYVQPERGVRTKTRLYGVFYAVLRPLFPLIRLIAPGFVSTSSHLGRAMINVAAGGYPTTILESRDINKAATPVRA